MILKIFREWEDGWLVCAFTSFISFQSHQDDGRVIMESSVQWNPVYNWKDFRLQLPSGIEPGTAWSIKPALNPHSATGRIERQRDRTTANKWDGQIIREKETDRDRERQRGRDENSFTYTAATSLLNFSNQLFCSWSSFFRWYHTKTYQLQFSFS